jgi:hypothetical protein
LPARLSAHGADAERSVIGFEAEGFRAALAKRRIAACIPSKSNRKTAIPYNAVLYKQRFGPASTPEGAPAPAMGERSGAPSASALCQSSCRNLRLRFNYRSQMSQLTVTHPTAVAFWL